MSYLQFSVDADRTTFDLIAPAGHKVLSGDAVSYSYAGATPTEIVYVFGSYFSYSDGYVVDGVPTFVLGVDQGQVQFEAHLYGPDINIKTLAAESFAEQFDTLTSDNNGFQPVGNAGPYTNTFTGRGGSDLFFDSAGHTDIDGGAGNDRVVLNSKFNAASVFFSGDGIDVTYADRSSHITNVEQFDFQDRSFTGVAALHAAVDVRASSFGTLTHDVHSVEGEVYALFEGLLGRAPDALGAEHWADVLGHGASLTDVTRSFLTSDEARTHYNAADNAAFVEQLYGTVLGRASDADGKMDWVGKLDTGSLSRAQVADAFVFSDENVAQLQPALNAGVFVADQDAANVARLYYGLLARAPDAAGLQTWTSAAHGGTPLSTISQAFLASSEYSALHPTGQTSAQFVDDLYVNALGRHADDKGSSSWVDQLAHGTSRADVAVGIAESPEAQQHHVATIEQGWHLT